MATKYGYLVDPNKQFQYKNGKNLTSGYLRVFDANTDDPAPTYSNWQLTPKTAGGITDLIVIGSNVQHGSLHSSLQSCSHHLKLYKELQGIK